MRIQAFELSSVPSPPQVLEVSVASDFTVVLNMLLVLARDLGDNILGSILQFYLCLGQSFSTSASRIWPSCEV